MYIKTHAFLAGKFSVRASGNYRFQLSTPRPPEGAADSERERALRRAMFYVCGCVGLGGVGGGGAAG